MSVAKATGYFVILKVGATGRGSKCSTQEGIKMREIMMDLNAKRFFSKEY